MLVAILIGWGLRWSNIVSPSPPTGSAMRTASAEASSR
jgi:hypothetical protein